MSALPRDSNTAEPEGSELQTNQFSSESNIDGSDSGSIADQNELIENNLLPGEQRDGHDGQSEDTMAKITHNPEAISARFKVISVAQWAASCVKWQDLSGYDRSHAHTKIDPLKTSAVDWLFGFMPKLPLSSDDVHSVVWRPAGWAGKPCLALRIDRTLYVAIDDISAVIYDNYFVDTAHIEVAWPEPSNPGSPYKSSEIRGRPSLKHYNASVSPQILNKITQTLDPTTAKFWQTSFQLRNEADALWILRYRAKGAQVGDNHLVLLVTAWQYYFDAIAASAATMVCAKLGQRTFGSAYNIYKDTNWVNSVAEQNKEIVNCVGMPQDYATFWAMCCLPSQELYAAKTSASGVVYRTPFGAFRRKIRTKMCVISEHTLVFPSTAPSWWTNPNLILSFIEMYAMKFGLDDQVNDALYCALQLPIAATVGTPISLPEPIHSKDWFEGMVEGGTGLDAVRQLHMSSTVAVTSAWAETRVTLMAVLGEIAESNLYNRLGINTLINPYSNAIREMVHAMSRPSVFSATLIAKTLNLPAPALELTGLHNSFMPVGQLVPPIMANYSLLSFWQHHLVPVLHANGYLVAGPNLSHVWKPDAELGPKHIVTTPFQLEILNRFGLIAGVGSERGSLGAYACPPSNAGGKVTVPVTDPSIRQKLALAIKYGIKTEVLDAAVTRDDVDALRDPAEAVELFNTWQYSGICPSYAGADVQYGGRQADVLAMEPPVAAPGGHATAGISSLRAAIRGAERALSMKRAAFMDKLTKRASAKCLVMGPNAVPSGALVVVRRTETDYNIADDDMCGWRLLASATNALPTVASVKRAVASLISKDPLTQSLLPDKLAFGEMAIISSVLGTAVTLIEVLACGDHRVCDVGECTVDSPKFYLSNGHWATAICGPAQNVTPLTTVGPRKGAKLWDSIPPKQKEAVYNKAIERFNARAFNHSQLLDVHVALFPERAIPRSLKEARYANPRGERGPGPIGGKCCLQCDANLSGREALQKLMENAVGSAYPHRNPAVATKNNVLIGDLVKVVTSTRGGECLPGRRAHCAAAWIVGRKGQAAEFVTSVGAWVLTNTISPAVWEWLWYDRGLACATEDTWLQTAKALHDTIRKDGLPADTNPNDSDWAQSLYLHSLYGRGGVVVDWATEFTNKTEGPAPVLQWDGGAYTRHAAARTIRETIHSVTATAYPKAMPKPFDQFMDTAYEWLVSGSSAGIPSVLKNSPMRDEILHTYGLTPRPTKRSVMEAIPRAKVKHILLKTKPKIVAKAHMKLNETGGKARAIYGVTLWHYIFSNWLTAPLEKHLDHPNIDINLAGSEMLDAVVARVSRVEEGYVFNSYDYPDFNAMHTHEYMAEVYSSAKRHALSAIDREGAGRYSSEDRELIERGFTWMQESNMSQYVLHPDTGEILRTTSGLYSGNRDTTLINTLLNIAYAAVVDESLRAKYTNPGVVERLCHGDDIITVHTSLARALLWNDEATACNLKGQESKLMIDHKHHEYLRIMGCSDNKLRGSLARCISTFCNGNWETDKIVGVWAKLQESANSLATWIRRGAARRTVQELWNVVRYRVLVDVYRFSDADARAVNIRTAGVTRGRSDPDYSRLSSYVTDPYIEHIRKELPMELRPTASETRRLKRVLQKSTYGTELALSFQQTDLTKVTDSATRAVINLGSPPGATKRYRQWERFAMAGATKADWQLRNRIKAMHHLLSALDLKSRQLSEVEVVSAVTQIPKAVVARVLEADAELARSQKSSPRWHLPAELASTLAEIEWRERAAAGDYPATLLGTNSYLNRASVTEVVATTSDYNTVHLSDMLLY